MTVTEANDMGQRARQQGRERFTNPFIGERAVAWLKGWQGEATAE